MEKPRYILADMTWPEFREALATVDLALIPTGATEQHGPGGTFAVDTARADGFTRLLAERLYPRAVAVPAIPFGFSPHHMPFPGTITLEADTFQAVVEEVVGSLHRHGLRKFFILNAHGGNRDALDLAIATLKDRYPEILIGWVQISGLVTDIRDPDGKESPLMGHGCERELSQSLYLAPWTVRPAAMGPSPLTDRAMALHHPAIKVGKTFDEITRDGGLGNSANASYELGRRLIETALDRLTDWLQANF